MKHTCPVCEEGHLTGKIEFLLFTHSGISTYLPCEYSVCDACGIEIAGKEQTERNKKCMEDFKRKVNQTFD